MRQSPLKKVLALVALAAMLAFPTFAKRGEHTLPQEQIVAHAAGLKMTGTLRCPDMAKPGNGSHNIIVLRGAAGVLSGKCDPAILLPYLKGDWGGVGAHDATSEIYGPWHYAAMLAVYRFLPPENPVRAEVRTFLRAWLAVHVLGTVGTMPSELVILGPENYRKARPLSPVHSGLWFSAPGARSAVVDGKPPGQVEVASAHRILSAALLGRWQSDRNADLDFAPRLLTRLGATAHANDPEFWGLNAFDRHALLRHVRNPTPETTQFLLRMLEGFRPPGNIVHTWAFYSGGVLSWSAQAYHQPKAGQGSWLLSGTIGDRTFRGTARHPKDKGPGYVSYLGRKLFLWTLSKKGRVVVESLDLGAFGFTSHLVVWDARGWRVEQPERAVDPPPVDPPTVDDVLDPSATCPCPCGKGATP